MNFLPRYPHSVRAGVTIDTPDERPRRAFNLFHLAVGQGLLYVSLLAMDTYTKEQTDHGSHAISGESRPSKSLFSFSIYDETHMDLWKDGHRVEVPEYYKRTKNVEVNVHLFGLHVWWKTPLGWKRPFRSSLLEILSPSGKSIFKYGIVDWDGGKDGASV